MVKSNIRVMIVAEIDEYIDLLTKWLEVERYQVIVLPNKLKLIKLVHDLQPNVILISKEGNGIKFCNTIKQTKRLAEIPIILMHDDDERFDSKSDAELTISFERTEVLSRINILISS